MSYRARVRWFLVLLAGCYAPDPPAGARCGPGLACPTGLDCVFERCVAEPPPCIEITAGAGQLAVPRLDSAIAIDGDLADWPTCFITVDQARAGLVRDLGAGGRYAPGRFSLAAAADDDRVFLAAEVEFVLPLGDHAPPEVYLNHAISAYFDADGVALTSVYDTDATQIVVDHANRTAGFRSGTGVVPVPGMVSATARGATTFTIEMSVTPATFGRTAFADAIGFDIGLVGGNGDEMTSELVWFQACTRPACGCAGDDSAPFCDARQFGRAAIPARR